MASGLSSAHIETEIQRLLSAGEPLDGVIHHLIKNFSNKNLSRDEIETISIFFLHAGYYSSLCQFTLGCLSRGLIISWPHFCEALFLSNPAIPEAVKTAIIKGADSQGQLENLARSQMLDHFDDRLAVLRQKRQSFFQQQLQKRRKEMLSTLAVLQAQGLHDEEQRLIEKFALIFPNDGQMKEIVKSQNKKRNIELVQEIKTQQGRWIPLSLYQQTDQETIEVLACVEASMKEALDNFPSVELAQDFAIAHVTWENYNAALNFVDWACLMDTPEEVTNHHALAWLRLEILFRLRRFLEVLDEIARLEQVWGASPDFIFALLYLRAQCLWELAQRQHAIDIMESIIVVRPQYRSARIFLAEWKGEAT